MTTRQAPSLSRANAEALLTGTASEPSELAQIIAAARGPAGSYELAGEAAAMIRFQAALLEPAAADPPTARKRMSERLLAAKVGIAAALAAAATGGVALAAVAHTQTEPAHRARAAGTSGVAAPSHDRAPTRNATTAAVPPPLSSHPAAVSAAPTPPGRPSSHPSASPSPSLRGLCVAYLANGIAGGKQIDNPAFGALVTAAGGKDKVTTYCLTLLLADPHPTGPAKSYPVGPPIPAPGHRRTGPPNVPTEGPQADQP